MGMARVKDQTARRGRRTALLGYGTFGLLEINEFGIVVLFVFPNCLWLPSLNTIFSPFRSISCRVLSNLISCCFEKIPFT